MPPCDVIANAIELTNVTGILHVSLEQYEDTCPITNYENISWEYKERRMVEIEVDTGIVRTEEDQPWMAESTSEKLGLDMPQVDQSGYSISYASGSESLTVEGDKFEGGLTYNLTNFTAPAEPSMYEGVVSFYSEKLQRLFFIYPTTDGLSSVASCTTMTGSESCTFTEMEVDMFDIDKVSDNIKVYDSMQLVGLPVVCCLCVESHYYVFDESTILKKVDVLGNTIKPIAVDSRVSKAYAVLGGYGEDIGIVFESITIDNEIDTQVDVFMTSKELEDVFDQVTDDPTTSFPTPSPHISSHGNKDVRLNLFYFGAMLFSIFFFFIE